MWSGTCGAALCKLKWDGVSVKSLGYNEIHNGRVLNADFISIINVLNSLSVRIQDSFSDSATEIYLRQKNCQFP